MSQAPHDSTTGPHRSARSRPERNGPPRVGIVGAGQLARMMVDAAHGLGVECVVASRPGDDAMAGAGLNDVVREVTSFDTGTLLDLDRDVDVVTFDHEPVDLAAVRAAFDAGANLRPGPDALAFSDKAHQRTALSRLGLAVPPFLITRSGDQVRRFGSEHGWPIMVKAPRGGYDGRGVDVAEEAGAAVALMQRFGGRAVIEPRLDLRAELSVVTVRTEDGTIVSYPPVETTQHDGMCHEVVVPSMLPHHLLDAATAVAEAVAAAVEAIGVLAVELFVVGDSVLVNEVAPRPHNSGHLTIEACAASQFENHLRAVIGWPLGPTELVVPAAAMVNVVGTDRGTPSMTTSPGVTVHGYGKAPRPGRKLGHVTAVAASPAEASRLARASVS